MNELFLQNIPFFHLESVIKKNLESTPVATRKDQLKLYSELRKRNVLDRKDEYHEIFTHDCPYYI